MRIRVSGRCIAAMAVLAAFLCLLPVSANVASARPIGWDDLGPPPPPGEGDNDGVVLKSPSLRSGTTGYTQEASGGIRTNYAMRTNRQDAHVTVRLYFAVMRANYWSFWLR